MIELFVLSKVGNILLNILYFVIALSFVITIHELGHFATAKMFKVYCHEFSIGFGPKIFSKKRKNGETAFSFRAIPLGGYVAMYGEEESSPDPALNIPKERSLAGVAKWKRAIIMSAGIIMNFILAIVLFSANRVLCKQNIGTSQIIINEDSAAKEAGLLSYDEVTSVKITPTINGKVLPAVIKPVEPGNYYSLADALSYSAPTTKDDKIIYEFSVARKDGETVTNHTATLTLNAISDVDVTEDHVDLSWQAFDKDFGLSIYTYKARVGFVRGMQLAGRDFKDSFLLIGQALGQLFTGKGFENLGGPIALFQQSSMAMEMGFGMFLYLWGAISVNLGIFNLLPFPGLDGWHLLVVIIEGIFRKEIPNKVKNIISTIGMILLFILMGAVFIKDIINFGGIVGLL